MISSLALARLGVARGVSFAGIAAESKETKLKLFTDSEGIEAVRAEIGSLRSDLSGFDAKTSEAFANNLSQLSECGETLKAILAALTTLVELADHSHKRAVRDDIAAGRSFPKPR